MIIKPFERITLSGPEILDYPATQRILKNLKKYNLLPENFSDQQGPEIIDALHETHRLTFESHKRKAPENHPVGLGKRTLHLTTQPGTFMKQCPGSNDMLCCHYHIVNMVSNCPFDCSYCYLQTYLNQPLATFYVNEEDIFTQVRKICERPPISQLRVGTGELSDSLAWDPITEFSGRLADVMADYPNVRLELKTKSSQVEHLIEQTKNSKRRDHVIIGWSINAPYIIEKEEHGTARFHERLRAAKLCAEAGFQVSFHFDPMIYFDGWENHYRQAAQELLSAVPNHKIQWISMGALRYLPQLKPIALKRHPETSLFDEESTKGEDGKVRYLRNTRTEMFQFMNHTIKSISPNIYTYLCMETKPVWEKAMGRLPDREF